MNTNHGALFVTYVIYGILVQKKFDNFLVEQNLFCILKNMKALCHSLALLFAANLFAPAAEKEKRAADAKTNDGNWTALFNGRDWTGWHMLPGGEWSQKDGVIIGKSPKGEKRHGLLVSDKRYKNFHARFEFRTIQGCSGIPDARAPESACGISEGGSSGA